MFLPQQPFVAPGSLRDQVLYGCRKELVPDVRIIAVLKEVGFGPALERVGGLDVEREWSKILSLGEQQLLGFARVLLAQPRVAFLDEATGGLEVKHGRYLYGLLSETPI